MSLTLKIVITLIVLGVVAFAIPHYQSQMAGSTGNALKGDPVGVPVTPIPMGTPIGVTPAPTPAPGA